MKKKKELNLILPTNSTFSITNSVYPGNKVNASNYFLNLPDGRKGALRVLLGGSKGSIFHVTKCLKFKHQEIIFFNYNTVLSQHFLPKHPRRSNSGNTDLAIIAALMAIGLPAHPLHVHPPPQTPPP